MSKKNRTVVLYGNSLVLTGIAASLASQPHLTLYQVKTNGRDLTRDLATLKPDVLIFDLTTNQLQDTLILLQEQSHCLLIGIDINTHEMRQWASQHARALTIQDLVQAIHNGTSLADE